jgi:hypothetical protein
MRVIVVDQRRATANDDISEHVYAMGSQPISITIVISMVLCDQYKDGAGRIFDYPLYETYFKNHFAHISSN